MAEAWATEGVAPFAVPANEIWSLLTCAVAIVQKARQRIGVSLMQVNIVKYLTNTLYREGNRLEVSPFKIPSLEVVCTGFYSRSIKIERFIESEHLPVFAL